MGIKAGLINALKQLSEDIFACFLQSDYEDNLYLYEHRIHVSKLNCVSLIQKYTKDEEISCVLAVYNGLIDCGLLRWRVKDKTVFGVCREEMAAISGALISLIGGKESDLSMKISAFESINQSVLQVASKEPLPFMLFVGGLKQLEENCLAIYRTASA